MKNNELLMYTTDYISGTLSLRKPQEKSLEILDNILNHISPSKDLDLSQALEEVKRHYPICTDFERDFLSLAFVLATGERVIIVMGAVCVMKPRVSGTLYKYITCIA